MIRYMEESITYRNCVSGRPMAGGLLVLCIALPILIGSCLAPVCPWATRWQLLQQTFGRWCDTLSPQRYSVVPTRSVRLRVRGPLDASQRHYWNLPNITFPDSTERSVRDHKIVVSTVTIFWWWVHVSRCFVTKDAAYRYVTLVIYPCISKDLQLYHRSIQHYTAHK